MAITSRHYVPVLRWRMGEYQALEKLSDDRKDAVVPLFEILPPDYDFEQRKPKKDIDEHLKTFGDRLLKKWGERPALLDAGRLDPTMRMRDGRHPLVALFDAASALGLRLTPVTTLERDATYQAAVKQIDDMNLGGAVLRCSLAEALDPDFDANVAALLAQLTIGPGAIDLVLDLETPAFKPHDFLVNVVVAALTGASIFAIARSVTILATSFPESLADFTRPIQRITRLEWQLYKAVLAALPGGTRRPGFGDYGVAALTFAQGDMRFMRGSPNVRYAVDDGWLIARTKRKPGGSNQAYPALCGSITSAAEYLGSTYSAGSRYIAQCQVGAVSRGNPTTWKWVGTNHHITKVVDDLASLP